MKITSKIILIICLLLLALGGIYLFSKYAIKIPNTPVNLSGQNLPKTEIAKEEYQVYSTLFNLRFDNDKSLINLIILKDKTTLGDADGDFAQIHKYLEKNFKTLENTTQNDFLNKNRKSWQLTDRFNANFHIQMISNQEIENLFDTSLPGSGWDRFYSKYPNSDGINEISRVGFNNTKTQALVYSGNQGNFGAGRGQYYLVILENDRWIIKETVLAWVY